jgi:protein-glutamine gamma-glutamyltransferase
MALWVVGAITAWAGIEIGRMGSERRLTPSREPLHLTRFNRAATAVVSVACLMALLFAAVASLDLSSALSRPGSARPGRSAGSVGSDLAPYVGLDNQLDTSARGTPSNAVVLRVKADAPDFWRGAAFDRYDGRIWSQSPALASGTPGDDIFGGGVDDARLAAPREALMRQSVRVEAAAVGLVFGAPQIQGVNLPTDSYDERADGSFQLRTPLGKGVQYVVTSDRVLTTSDILRTNDPRTFGIPPELQRLYVDGGGATPRVAALAAQIAGDAPTTYDAIRRLESWLGANTKYTLDIPPLRAGADTVEQFLFVDKRGFCMQIASSLTVMLRSLGVPARLVTGFAPGEESLLGGEFTVRGKDAHAWVEVWFPGVGWQGFDPTASVPLAGEYSSSTGARLGRIFQRLLPVLLAIGVLIAAGVGIAMLLRRRRRPRSVTPWVSSFYASVQKEGAKRGRARSPSETPAAYVRALGATVLPHPGLDVVGEVVTAAAYSGEEPSPEARAEAERIFALACRSESG